MNKLLTICLVASCLLVACVGKPKYTYFMENDFREGIKLYRSADINIFGNIEQYCVVDSFIVVMLKQNTSMFGLYNANTLSEIKSWGNKGRAGNEYLMPKVIKYADSRFVIWDKPCSRMEFYDVNHPSYMEQIETKEINDMPNLVCHAGNNTFVYERQYPHEISLFQWRLGDEPIKMTTLTEYAERYKNSDVYSGFLEADESRNRVIYAFQFIDGFDIMDMNGKTLKKVRRKNSSAPSLNSNGGIDGYNSNTYCFGLRKGTESFFLYHVGFCGTEWLKDMKRRTYIEEFDWDGNPLRRYELPMIVSNLDCLLNGRFVIQDNTSEDAILQIFSF